MLALQIEAAQGKDTAAKLATQNTKLANNIKLDKAAAGQTSTSIDFQGTSEP